MRNGGHDWEVLMDSHLCQKLQGQALKFSRMANEEEKGMGGNGGERQSLEEISESFRGYLSSVQNVLQCAWFDDVLARNDDDMFVIGHGNMLAFS